MHGKGDEGTFVGDTGDVGRGGMGKRMSVEETRYVTEGTIGGTCC